MGFKMSAGEVNSFDEDEEEQSPALKAGRKATPELPQSAARLKERRYRVEECQKALDKMLKTWKVEGSNQPIPALRSLRPIYNSNGRHGLQHTTILFSADSKLLKTTASVLAAHPAGRGRFFGPRSIRAWTTSFEGSRQLHSSTRGKKGKNPSPFRATLTSAVKCGHPFEETSVQARLLC